MKQLFALALAGSAHKPSCHATGFHCCRCSRNIPHLVRLSRCRKVCSDCLFYTTCVPCQTAAPQSNASYENFGCNTGDVIFQDIDQGDSDAEVIAFDNTYGAHYPCISGDAGGKAICSTMALQLFRHLS